MIDIRIRKEPVEPGKLYSVAIYLEGQLADAEPFEDYDEARLYAMGLRDGIILAKNAAAHATANVRIDYGRQESPAEEV